jgi:hypothetical protein
MRATEVIATHGNTDFDAFASMLAARRLYPDAVVAISGSLNRNVREFYRLHADELDIVEAGRLELDAPVRRYLPWFRVADADASARITVRHLLYQTSGLPGSAGNDGVATSDQSDSALEREVRALRSVQLNRPVGATHQYSNANYITLGLVVQTAAGQSYEAYVHDQTCGHSACGSRSRRRISRGRTAWPAGTATGSACLSPPTSLTREGCCPRAT